MGVGVSGVAVGGGWGRGDHSITRKEILLFQMPVLHIDF